MSHPDAVTEPAHRLCVNVERCERRGAVCGLARRHSGGNATMRCIERGERIPPGDDHRLLVHTVHSGVVALCAGLTDGRRQIVALATAGEPLCTCSGLAHECWLEALAPSVLCVVDLAADDAAVLRRDNEMLNALLRATSASSRRSRGCSRSARWTEPSVRAASSPTSRGASAAPRLTAGACRCR